MEPTNELITIRRAESIADYHAIQRVQRAAWGITDDSYVVPVATMVGAQLHGGLVLGAFRPDGEAVGMSFAFLGRVEGRLCLYSQLTGVAPGWQDHGIGLKIKTTQRDLAREAGVPCIAWAFDPLQAGNARFNLAKLGATGVRYIVDMYGPRSDALNRYTPTDRLIVVWETEGAPPRTLTPNNLAGAPRIVASSNAPDGPPEPTLDPGAVADPGLVLLEVPDAITRLRAERPDAARRWGDAVRAGFQHAFAEGRRVVGFVREDGPEGRRAYHVLERADHDSSAA